ncbi:MAG: YciI family protein [Fimbriimonadaceae bacterium]|nr:YciI family protein [Fimbriimonadaceae bacterium]
MPRYLVAIYRPNDYDAFSAENAEMGAEIDALNQAMVDAGVRIFVGGLQPISTAHSIRRDEDGHLTESPGLYLDAGEHVGGLWVLDVADAESAQDWGRRAAVACRASVEVRPFH